MSGISPESQAQVVIDIIGVMPAPADMNRYFRAGWRNEVNWPAGPRARRRIPGCRWSIIQRAPRLPGCAFTVIEIESGRDGEDEIV